MEDFYDGSRPLRVAFDIGGVISTHPPIFLTLLRALAESDQVVVYIITDMDRDRALELLRPHHILETVVPLGHVLSANWTQHQQNCKSILCAELEIDVLIDDHLPYLFPGPEVGLLVVPRNEKPYHAPGWLKEIRGGEH